MRCFLFALALAACGESGGGRSDVDAPPITEAGPREGGIPDRLPSEPPPCVLPDALASLRESPIPACGTQFCGPDEYCCAGVPRCCNPCDPTCCPSTDGGWMPVDAPSFDAQID